MNNNDTNFNGNNNMNPMPNGFNSNPMGYTPNPENGVSSSPMNAGPENLQGMSLGTVENSQTVNPNVSPMNPSAVDSSVPPVAPTMDANSMNPSFGNPGSPVSNEAMNLGMNQSQNVMPNGFNNNVNMNQPMDGNVNFMNSMNPGTPVSNEAMNLGMNQPTMMNNAPVNNTISPVEGLNSGGMQAGNVNQGVNMGEGMPNPFGNPNMNANPNNMNPMGNNNMFGSVPTPPPMADLNNSGNNGKKSGKFKLSKTTIILIVVLLIAIIGCGVYLILSNSKPAKSNVSIVTNDLMWDLGRTLSTKVTDYATITGVDSASCTVDTSKVDNTKMGSYEYTVTCGNTSKVGRIILQDKVPPVVTVREVNVVPGSMITIEDFIVSCEDYTACSYELENETPTLEEMVEKEGTYHINLLVTDDYNNQATVTLTLVVSNDAPVRYMYCTPAATQDDVLNAELQLAYNYGINSESMLSKSQKIYLYTFEDEEEYLALKEDYDAEAGINGILGETVFDDDEFTITITVNITETELASEFNMNPFPTTYDELKQFNVNQGISCKNR